MVEDDEKWIAVDNKFVERLGQVIGAVLTYERATGRKLNITAEVGEVLACHHPLTLAGHPKIWDRKNWDFLTNLAGALDAHCY